MHEVAAPADALAWLDADDGALTGYDHPGWPRSTWVLHAMYEHPDVPADLTHDDVFRVEQVRQPVVLDGLDIDARTEVTGIPLGFAPRPDPPARRLRWAEYTDLAVERPVPPCHRWFPHGVWPARLTPPPEGSLDEVSVVALVDVFGAEVDCHAFYGSCVTGDFERPAVFEGPLASLPDLVRRFGATPSNLWPADRSWFLWTDWDLMGTKVSGSAELVAAVRAHPDLETLDLSPAV